MRTSAPFTNTGPMAGSPSDMSNLRTSSVVELAVNWLYPPSAKSNVTSDPESTVRTGLRALFHFM